jgi:hypothetical protein
MRRPVGALTAAFGTAALFGFLVAVAAPRAATAGAARPSALTLSNTAVVPGETVTVTGTGWPGDQKFQAAVCGGGSQATSQDCDLAHEVDFISNNDGGVGESIVVTIPPVPCPCVVLVTQVDPFAEHLLPITIAGAPSAPLPPQAPQPRLVTISHVHVVSKSSWTSWFGAAAPRELVLTVHNGGTYPVLPLLVAQVEQGSQRYPITSPKPRTLQVGGTTRIAAPFALSTFAHGDFSVVGMVTEGNYEEGFTSDDFALSTSTTPWALYALGIMLGVAVVGVLALALKRRLRGGDPHDGDQLGPKDDTTAQLTHIGAAP